MTIRVAFLTTHPIQYQVPVFRSLAERPEIDFTVLFCMIPDAAQQGSGFGVGFEWDIPLLDGYEYRELVNESPSPNVTSFKGCSTPAIGQTLDDLELDVLIINGWNVKSCLQGLSAARRRGIPVVVRGEANHLRPRPWWKRAFQRLLVRKFNAYGYIGTANRDFYRSYGVRDEQLFPARYCIENDRFASVSNADEQTSDLRAKYGIGSDTTCFLFSGKLEQKKHPVELIQAFAKTVNRTDARLHLLIVGDGELRRECEAAAESCRDQVTFAGFINQSQIPGHYATADCLVLPSDHGETWGLVVNEAMACGRPAIVSDQCGCAQDLIVTGETGWRFPFGDEAALVEAMLAAGQSRDQLKTMGQRAQSLIGGYSPSAAADGLLSAVEYAAKKSSPTRPRSTSSGTTPELVGEASHD